MQKILIIQTAFIGDVILATSLVEYAKKLYPNAQIDFLLRKGNESILETSPHITNLWIWNKNHGKFKSLIKLLLQVRKEKYDAVINIQRFFNSGLLTAFSGAKTKIGFHSNPLSFFFSHKIEHKIPHMVAEDKFLHEVQRNAQLLSPLQENFKLPESLEIPPLLYFTDDDHAKINELISNDGPYFVLAPSSVWFTKQWHESKWKELIPMLEKQGQVYLIGAPGDMKYTQELLSENSSSINLCGKLSLRQSALLMKNAKRVFVNDSAPLHLASSVNAKATAIFCSTVPEFGYHDLSQGSTLVQLTPRLDCMPCGLHGHKACPKGHFKCSNEINTQDVYQTINR